MADGDPVGASSALSSAALRAFTKSLRRSLVRTVGWESVAHPAFDFGGMRYAFPPYGP